MIEQQMQMQPVPQPVDKPESNGLALAGMVLGIVGAIPVLGWFLMIPSLLAVIFGHRSLHVIKRTGQTGRGFAITAIATGWPVMAFWLYIAIYWIVVGFISLSESGGYG